MSLIIWFLLVAVVVDVEVLVEVLVDFIHHLIKLVVVEV
jgi:hypothetical protein